MSHPDAPSRSDVSFPPAPAPPFRDPTLPPGPPPFWAYTPPAPLPPARPRWRRTRRACAVLAVVGVLVVLAAVAVAVQAFRDSRTPQAAVSAYFDALARGDAAAALGEGAVPEGGRALVSADVLRATLRLAPIDDVRTGAVTQQGDTATVAVRYRLGGTDPQEVDDTVALVRANDRWQLRRSAVPVTLSVDAAASWAAVPAATPFAVPSDTQLVFPGAVPVTYRSAVIEVAPTVRVVRLASTDTSVPVTAEVSAEGRAEVARSVLASLTSCVAGGTDVDPFCPQPPAGRAAGVVLRSVPQSFTGTLGRAEPELDLAVGPDSAGTITVSGTIAATGDWQVLDYDNVAQDRSGPVTITFGATVPVGATGTLRWERT